MWRISGSTLSYSHMTELLTLSLRVLPATLQRKLVFSVCLLAQLLCYHNVLVQWPHYCCTNLPASFMFHLFLTHEQNPKVLEFLHLGKGLSSNLEMASRLFSDSAPWPWPWTCWFSSRRPSACWKSRSDEANTTSSANRRDEILWSLNPSPSSPRIYIYKNKEQNNWQKTALP